MDQDKEIRELKKQVAILHKSNQENIERANALKDECSELEEKIDELKLDNITWEEVSREKLFKLEVVRSFLANQTSLHFAQMLVRIIDMDIDIDIDTEIMS